MGQSLSTKIVYGYSIGGEADGWQFEEYDEAEYEMRWPEWVELDGDGDDEYPRPDDFISQAQDRLLTQLTGFKLFDYGDYSGPLPPDSYDHEKNAAEKRLGLKFVLHGVGDWTEWCLGFEMARSSSSISELDAELIAGMLNPLNMADMDYRLREAIRVLQLHPKAQATPRLLLLASYF